ncbi:5'-Nucleotidase domain-containing protein [Isoalcanivorax pacificus W11-5]|uniref:5'-Nucleotidase domain-containing protein n=1 Tax=Isoalcanivorax pacificus W11-5 TaxID=391936 RepID=A0A0B4XND9_9GAMM|nr:5'-nucleotidase C-terminal domain-containing protein [Isoalcanivorax pacificus]AJD47973.1 5'-Nucleotidase domain-containing protein [Isoalcanivorax pacificus W11-5]
MSNLFRLRTLRQPALLAALAVGLSACGGDSNSRRPDVQLPAYRLQLLHFADVDGGGTAALENVAEFSALVSHFRSLAPANTLLVSSGDNYIPGPIYQAGRETSLAGVLGKPGVGRGDVALLNALGVQASAVGNHDLDGGTAEFAGIISPDGDWDGADFPWLSANLDFSTDGSLAPLVATDGQSVTNNPGKLAGSATVMVNGERIGLVGAVTPTLASITSTGGITISPSPVNPDTDAMLEELAAAIQPAVDALTDDGINKIILLAHMQQISVEKGLAPLLSDVDIIVAGGSNTLLATSMDALHPGDTAADTYPLGFTSATGEPVLVVNTNGDYTYLGRLVVDFDENGELLTNSVVPGVSGAWATLETVISQLGASPIDDVEEVADALRDVLSDKEGNVAGFTDVFLEGRRNFVRSQETNLGNLTADANLWYARQADATAAISLKNGGGIRAAIGQIIAPPGSTDESEVELLPPQENEFKPAGAVSQLDIETSLAFNNAVSLVTVTAAELHDLMEYAVSGANPGATPGYFPQIGGMRFSFDPTATARTGDDTNQGAATNGERIQTLVVDGDVVVANGTLQGDPARSFRMATLQYLVRCIADSGGNIENATCGDNYPFKNLTAPDRRDLASTVDFPGTAYDPGLSDFSVSGGEQDALAEYLLAQHADAENAFTLAETPAEQDERIQNLSQRNDTLAP